ncbi:hypothetical protein V490_04469 [Pseudogymnoascus sp. VKM F-3557]|nr:hypothetical protein V490_04469 [Pseudogymnoascus sp. VKM F-3557]
MQSELSPEPPAKQAKLTTSDFEMQSMVVFIVGKEKHMLQMPRCTVCASSELVDAEYKDQPDMAVLVKQFPNISVETFTLFLVWLSTGDLNNAKCFATLPESLGPLDAKDASKKLAQLIKCYHLAEVLISRPFKNYIADQICNHLEYLVDKDGLLEEAIVRNITLVYADATEDSKLKCLLEDAIVTCATDLRRWNVRITPGKEHMVSAFWNGVAIAAVQRTKELEAGRMRFPLNWGEEDRCKYHEHKNDDEVMDCRQRQFEQAG